MSGSGSDYKEIGLQFGKHYCYTAAAPGVDFQQTVEWKPDAV